MDKILVTLAGLALIAFVNVYFFGRRKRPMRPVPGGDATDGP